MDAGKLVPDELVDRHREGAAAAARLPKGFILDGFPRTIPQAEALDEALKNHGQGDRRGHLARGADRDAGGAHLGPAQLPEGRERLPRGPEPAPARRASATCAAAALVQREDDKAEKVRTRMQAYAAQTAPLKDFYAAQGPAPHGGRGRRSRGHRGRRGPQALGRGVRVLLDGQWSIKSAPRDRPACGDAGRIVAEILDALESRVAPGVTHLGPRSARRAAHPGEGRQAGLQGLPRLPGVLCACINDEVVHGIPCRSGSSPRAT